ncbi:unnamed protein product, partial [Tetraodon nigroviridis]
AHHTPEDSESEQLSSAASPQQPGPLLSPQGKLVIMVEDFYYGSTPQTPPSPQSAAPKPAGPYSCIHCRKTLSCNIRLMGHMQEHVSNMSLPGQRPMCPHCFRFYPSPFQLRCHIEAVHQPADNQQVCTCRICELTFADEPEFLQHMKNTHRPGEMPYVCQASPSVTVAPVRSFQRSNARVCVLQVCDFRSSFYSELWSHFEQFHANMDCFLCRYCLRVLQGSTCYQQHFSIHQ